VKTLIFWWGRNWCKISLKVEPNNNLEANMGFSYTHELG